MLKKFFTVTSLILASSFSQAALINPTGNADNLDFRWSYQESAQLQSYNERQDVSIERNQVQVDYLLGTNLFIGDTVSGQQSSIGSNYLDKGVYDSHLLHFDPIGTKGGSASKQLIEFDSHIVAIILNGKRLKASDDIFGGVDANYESSNTRKWEKNDFLTLTSTHSILVDRASVGRYWIDDARIITHSVSEPSPVPLIALGLVGLWGIRRQRKNQA